VAPHAQQCVIIILNKIGGELVKDGFCNPLNNNVYFMADPEVFSYQLMQF